jgi:hypothetical protein
MPLRHKALSYSSLETFNSCPRKFQLHKYYEDADAMRGSSVDMAFGHAVGTGIQSLLAGLSLNQSLLQATLAWSLQDLYAAKHTTKKNLITALDLVTNFAANELAGILEDWTLFLIDGKPCNELGFSLGLPDDYQFVGYLDVVLQHRTTKELACVELKTTGSWSVDEASYKNSAQTTGYALALDVLCRNLDLPPTIHVFYIVASSATSTFTTFTAAKSKLDRAELLTDLVTQTQIIQLYKESYGDVFPKRGSACMNFNRRCEYYGNCHLRLPLRDDIEIAYKNISVAIDYPALLTLQQELLT